MGSFFQSLQPLFEIANAHGIVEALHPIAIAQGRILVLYDGITLSDYKEVGRIEFPFDIPDATQAAFPLEQCDNRCVAVLGRGVVSTQDDMVTVLHEFVHCDQWESCEPTLRAGLTIEQHYKTKTNNMWEINHPFPYDKHDVQTAFSHYIKALSAWDRAGAVQMKQKICDSVSTMDFEYMVWQEWKEGYARYCENRLRKLLSLPITKSQEHLFDRVSLYASGELLITLLAHETNIRSLDDLFVAIRDF